jgi:hypothetical protein
VDDDAVSMMDRSGRSGSDDESEQEEQPPKKRAVGEMTRSPSNR